MSFKCPHCNEGIDNAIPKDRFDEVNNARKANASEIEQLQSQLEDASKASGTVTDLQAQLDDLTSRIGTQAAAHEKATAVMRVGITDADDIADLLAIYDRRAPEDVNLTEWLESDSLPRAAKALLPQQAIPASKDLVDVAAAPPVQPKANNGAIPATSAPSGFSPEAIMRMSASEYKSHREAIRSVKG